ncbi:MAG: PepSY-like domain-containing protein [Prevotella sp.]|jgi:uncharacterized membrane protein YkoI|nr:PepSY-like domain-containing protein [Prevotella sp.]
MKQKTLFLLLAISAIYFVGCSDDDDSNWDIVPSDVRSAFEEKYPSAKNIEWEDKGSYKVADFINDNMEASAWFDSKGTWYMTETDLPFNLLPQPVKDAFGASEYSTWKVDDVDMLERKDSEVIYIIEVEYKNKEVDLYYNAEGILVKTVEDNDDNDYESHIPQPASTEIEAFIKEKYPEARIIEIEKEKGRIEVDIIHNNIGKEVVFDTNNQWLYTLWDVRVSSLPQTVAGVVNDSQYAGYHIDDAEFVETSQGNYYLLELEKGNSEIDIKVDENGNILV